MDLIATRILEFITDNINLYLLMLIIFSGIFITKYTQDIWKIKDAYKVLFASIVFSIIFYFIDNCTENCAPKYLFTYLFATSLYELIMKFVLSAADRTFKTKTTITVEEKTTGTPNESKKITKFDTRADDNGGELPKKKPPIQP